MMSPLETATLVIVSTTAVLVAQYFSNLISYMNEKVWCNSGESKCRERQPLPRKKLFRGPNQSGYPFCRACFEKAFGRAPTNDDRLS